MKNIVTEAQVRSAIRSILTEQEVAATTSESQVTYYWNDAVEMFEKLELPQYSKFGSQAIEPGFTKYRYSYTPATGEIKIILPAPEKAVKKDTRAYDAIKQQFGDYRDMILQDNGVSIEPLYPTTLNQSLVNRMMRKSILLVYGIFDNFEEFLDKGISGKFGEDIKKNLLVAYPDGLLNGAQVGSFNEDEIRKMKDNLEVNNFNNIVMAPILPNKPERFANLTKLIKDISNIISVAMVTNQTVSPELIKKTVSLNPSQETSRDADILAGQINVALQALYDLVSPETKEFARLGLGGQSPGELERAEVTRIFGSSVASPLRTIA
jgi:hypothetical protein